MFGGRTVCNFVMRLPSGSGTGAAAQHSESLESWFVNVPGLKVVAPSTPYDLKGLLLAAVADQNPIIFVENKLIYKAKGAVPEQAYLVPIGKAVVRRPGTHVTIVGASITVPRALEAADKLAAEGIEAEVIDLRWLDRASIDWTTIEESIKKTNNVLLVEQGVRGTSYGGWLADEIQRRYFDWLDQPVQRVTGAEASPSISKVLERAATARTEEVVNGLKLVMQAKGFA